ncbi:cytochrome c oxidase subunit 3 [Vicingaceae bacterium]|nr:cytochrome c oxidase subunit 3 [Vicingaceae bacterium]
MTTTEDNQHFQLSYQSGLPIPNSKLIIWLFLSTEIMFFSALIGTYIVLRFGVAGGNWPSPKTVGVVEWIGALNTFVLLCSSATIVFCLEATRKNDPSKAKRWLLLTMLLGTVFLGIKAVEYDKKFRHGIHPLRPRSLVHDRADIYYVSAVKESLEKEIANLQATSASRPPIGETAERITLLEEMKSGIAHWTSKVVGQSDNEFIQDLSLRAMAYQIYPIAATEPGVPVFVESELERIKVRCEQLEQENEALNKSVEAKRTEVTNLDNQLNLLNNRSGLSDEEIQNKTQLTTRKTTVSNVMGAEIRRLTAIKNELIPIEDRIKIQERLAPNEEGINDHYGLKLPIVIPNGNTWANTYFLLTGLHAVHVLLGIAAFLFLVPMKLGNGRQRLVENIALYWHFVDIVWIFLFPLIYLF